MAEALVTVVVTPRERYSTTERCLATVAANTSLPYQLVCVLGTSPRYAAEAAEKACTENGWHLVSRPGLLSPNEARNVGLEHVTTRYVVFVDNDVVVAPGWLEALVGCAEETGADVVGPLVLYGEPEDGEVHSTGGTIEIVERDGRREVVERHLVENVRLNEESLALERTECDFGEFHGLLVRCSVFDRTGPLDEGVLATAEHLDLALELRRIGGTTWSEPAAMISYLSSGLDYTLGDVELFRVRWGEEWCERGLDHFCAKWDLDRDGQFIHELALYARFLRARVQVPDTAARPDIDELASRSFAQTNVQLFNQLRAAATPSHDLEKVRAAYDIATQLFSGRHRPSGKTFLAHLVGTASVLVSFGWRPPVVTAGLLHAAYVAGGFPPRWRDDEAQRRWLRRRAGRLAEEIVHTYTHLDLHELRRRIDADDLDRVPVRVAYAVVVRLANAIDEQNDCASAYWGTDAEREHRARDAEAWAPVIAAIAPRVGASGMVALLRALEARTAEPVPDVLRSQHTGNYLVTDRGTTEPLVARVWPEAPAPVAPDPARFVAPPGPPALTHRVARVRARDFHALEGGCVKARWRTALVECDPRQWAYSAAAELGDLGAPGPGALRLRVAVERGELGIGVLEPDSWSDLVVPEWSHGPTDGTVEIVLRLDAIEEAGRIVLRSWAATGEHTSARVHSVEVFRLASPVA